MKGDVSDKVVILGFVATLCVGCVIFCCNKPFDRPLAIRARIHSEPEMIEKKEEPIPVSYSASSKYHVIVSPSGAYELGVIVEQ